RRGTHHTRHRRHSGKTLGLDVEPGPFLVLAHHGRTHHALSGRPPARRISRWYALSRGTKSRSASPASRCHGGGSDVFHRVFCHGRSEEHTSELQSRENLVCR